MADQVTNVNVTAEDNGNAKQVKVPSEFVLPLRQRLTSRRLWMTIFACTLPWIGLERGVNHLYALAEWQAAVYGSMFLAVMGGIITIVAKYVGIDASYSASSNVVGAISAAASHVFERREEKIEVDERIVRDMEQRYKGDPSYRPIQIDAEETFR